MSFEKGQLESMRKDADRRIIVEMLPTFSMEEMRQVLLFLQQSISARGRGIVRGELVPYEPGHNPTEVAPTKRRGFLNRRAPSKVAARSEHIDDTAPEEADGLDGRRLMLYRRLGQLSAAQLDEVQALLDQISPIVAADADDSEAHHG